MHDEVRGQCTQSMRFNSHVWHLILWGRDCRHVHAACRGPCAHRAHGYANTCMVCEVSSYFFRLSLQGRYRSVGETLSPEHGWRLFGRVQNADHAFAICLQYCQVPRKCSGHGWLFGSYKRVPCQSDPVEPQIRRLNTHGAWGYM